MVTLTFDDGNVDQLEAVRVLNEFGMRATFFLTSGSLDERDRFTIAQARELRAAGHEIGGHTVDHVPLTELPPDEATWEVCTDRETLTAAGLGPIVSFAYPFSASDHATAEIVGRCGYRWGRSQGGIDRAGCVGPDCVFAEAPTPPDPLELRAPRSVKSSWTLADLQGDVVRAENGGGGLVAFTFHHVCDGCAEAYKITPGLFRKFVAWLASRADRGTVVLPLAQALGQGRPDMSPPTVRLTSPIAGALFEDTLEVSAEATDDEGIAEVRFFVDEDPVATVALPPYAAIVVPAFPGKRALVTARAIDLAGNEASSAAVAVVRAGLGVPFGTSETSPGGTSGGCAQVPGETGDRWTSWLLVLALFLAARGRTTIARRWRSRVRGYEPSAPAPRSRVGLAPGGSHGRGHAARRNVGPME